MTGRSAADGALWVVGAVFGDVPDAAYAGPSGFRAGQPSRKILPGASFTFFTFMYFSQKGHKDRRVWSRRSRKSPAIWAWWVVSSVFAASRRARSGRDVAAVGR
jgi:hypothetical protein